MNGKHTLPADIERTSMAIITQELAAAGIELPPQHAAVVKRVIHTTADFDYAQSLCFTPDAVARGVAALRQGVSIVTDTNMAKAGVSKPSLAKLGGTVACFMADGDVARAAQENGTTRADAAMEKAAREYPGAVLAVGNAPTALLRLEALIADGLRPALVVAVPVGFVNVVESKERIFARAAAMWPRPSATRCFTRPWTHWTPPGGAGRADSRPGMWYDMSARKTLYALSVRPRARIF